MLCNFAALREMSFFPSSSAIRNPQFFCFRNPKSRNPKFFFACRFFLQFFLLDLTENQASPGFFEKSGVEI
jgi:hypothetical protein